MRNCNTLTSMTTKRVKLGKVFGKKCKGYFVLQSSLIC